MPTELEGARLAKLADPYRGPDPSIRTVAAVLGTVNNGLDGRGRTHQGTDGVLPGSRPEYDVTSSPPGDPLAVYGKRIEKALDAFRPMGRVLEIASGTGSWTVHLLRYASSITALDSSRQMHELSRKKTGGDARVHYVRADVFSWEPDGRYDVVFFANWLSHVPPGRLHRFWEMVRAALAPGGRVFFVDELEDAWRRDERFRETFAGDPSVPVVRRSLRGGRTFRVVKVFWKPGELRPTLDAKAGTSRSTQPGPSSAGPRLFRGPDRGLERRPVTSPSRTCRSRALFRLERYAPRMVDRCVRHMTWRAPGSTDGCVPVTLMHGQGRTA